MGNQHKKKPDSQERQARHRETIPHTETANETPVTTFALSPAAVMRLQRTIGNQAVQRLLVGIQPELVGSKDSPERAVEPQVGRINVQRRDTNMVRRDDQKDANPPPLWSQVSGNYGAYTKKLSDANQKSNTVTRAQWMSDLNDEWAKMGAPGEKSDAELQKIADVLKQYKATIKAENDQAQAHWKDLIKSYDEDEVWDRKEVWAEYARKLLKETFVETRKRVKDVGDVLTFEDLAQLDDRINNRTHEKSAEKRQYDIDNPPKRKEPPGFTKFKIRMLAGGELSVGPAGGTVQTYSLEELGDNGRSGTITFTAVGASGGAKAGGGFYSTSTDFSTSVPMRLEDFAGGGRIASGGLGPFSYSVIVFYTRNKPTVEVSGWGAQIGLTAGASWMHGMWDLRTIN